MAISSFGTLLKVGDGESSETFTTIFEVGDISGPGLGLDTEESTNHSSPGGWEEVIATILRTGEVTFPVNYEPTEATLNATTGLIADVVARTLRNFQLVFPDAGSTTWSFAAYVTAFEPGAPVNGKLTADVTLKPSGQPTLA
jgi:hypothetical protein